jgi:hypothetical protein
MLQLQMPAELLDGIMLEAQVGGLRFELFFAVDGQQLFYLCVLWAAAMLQLQMNCCTFRWQYA